MDEPVGQIDRRARGATRGTKRIPFGAAEDFIDQHGDHMPCARPLVNPADNARLIRVAAVIGLSQAGFSPERQIGF